MNRLRAPERERFGNLRLTDTKDDDLALFREMRKSEKERNNLLLHNSDEFDASDGPKAGSPPMFNIASAALTPVHKTGAADLFNSDNDKNDYDWLLTPPGTPLFPSLEVESQKTLMSQLGTPKTFSASQKSRAQPVGRNNLLSRHQSLSPALNTSSGGLRRPSSAGGPGSRPATPTEHTSASSASRLTLSSNSNKSALSAIARPSLSAPSKSASTPMSKPSRSITPTRSALPLAKTVVPPRSSTPISRPPNRSSTPTSRSSIPAPKTIPRSSTPPRSLASGSSSSSTPAVRFPASTSAAQPPTSQVKNPVPTRSKSPMVRPRPWKPSEMPGFTLDAPPNLRTSLPERPSSVNRGRPGVPSSRSSSIEPASNGRIRRQSCSPARGRPPNGVAHSSGSSVPVNALKRLQAKANDNVSPVLTGTRMVERMINMRKLAPPKYDSGHSPHSNLSGKSSSPDSSGFGRMLSKKSLDMAIRHMDIRRTIPGSSRPQMPSIPASSGYNMRLGQTRKIGNVSDSPLASSNASSEVSVNNGMCVAAPEVDDDVTSGKKGFPSSANLYGR